MKRILGIGAQTVSNIDLICFFLWFLPGLGPFLPPEKMAPGMLRMHMNTCMHGSVTCAGTETWLKNWCPNWVNLGAFQYLEVYFKL